MHKIDKFDMLDLAVLAQDKLELPITIAEQHASKSVNVGPTEFLGLGDGWPDNAQERRLAGLGSKPLYTLEEDLRFFREALPNYEIKERIRYGGQGVWNGLRRHGRSILTRWKTEFASCGCREARGSSVRDATRPLCRDRPERFSAIRDVAQRVRRSLD